MPKAGEQPFAYVGINVPPTYLIKNEINHIAKDRQYMTKILDKHTQGKLSKFRNCLTRQLER